MKYEYFYQTSTNENKSGFVKAKNRAHAYALLRKQGIRPYRLKGDDPANWQPWAIGGGFVLTIMFFLAFAYFLNGADTTSYSPIRRQQLTGESSVIAHGLETGWEGVLPTNLDRYLAAYAQPGWIALPPDFSESQVMAFKDELAVPLRVTSADSEAVVVLKRILSFMREEFKMYLSNGGTTADYLKFLEERQDAEWEMRKNAMNSVLSSPSAMRERVIMNCNVRLREMGMAELAL